MLLLLSYYGGMESYIVIPKGLVTYIVLSLDNMASNLGILLEDNI